MGSLDFHIAEVPLAALAPHGNLRLPERLAAEGAAALGFPLLSTAAAGHTSGGAHLDREAAAAEIARQNPALPAPPPEADYIVAGQQAGLLTGPLYAVLKAISAIALARHLSMARGQPVLPLFWIASEDHDVLEVNRVTVNGRQFVHEYPGELARGEVPQVGDLDLSDAREPLLAFLEEALPATEFRPRLLERIAALDLRTYTSAFRDLMAGFFAAWELRLIDPIPLRPLTAPVLADLVEHWDGVTAAFSAGSETLRARGFTPPLEKPGFFELHAGKRVPVRVADGRVQLATEKLPLREAAARIRREPQRFSPGAALRPVCQDGALPVLATLAGPTELAYLWQIEPLYDVIDATPSLRHPRISATFLEPPIRRAAEKAGLGPADLFRTPEMLAAPEKKSPAALDAAAPIDGRARALLEAIDRLETRQPNPRWLRKSRSAIESAAARIVTELHREHHEAAGLTQQRLEKIAAAVLPGGRLQERNTNVVQFLNLHGEEFLRQAVATLDAWSLQHQVVAIGDQPQEQPE